VTPLLLGIPSVTVPPIPRDAAHDAARRELAKRIYHRYDDPWPVAALKAVEHWLGRVFSSAARHAPGGGAGALAFVLLLVALVAFARWRLGALRSESRAVLPVLGERSATAAEHRRLAEQAAAAARWGDAVVEGMRAIARELEGRAVLDPRPGRTAEELAREGAAALPTAATLLADAARTFDAVAYGGRPGDAEGYRQVREADEAVRRARRGVLVVT
jgi:hypothetical protein